MLISLCLETDKKYSDKQMITDIHSWSLTHSWEKSQCKKYLSYYFFIIDYWFDKIDVKDNC